MKIVVLAGGISTEGWETLWKYCAEGKYSSDDTYKYGFDPLNKACVRRCAARAIRPFWWICLWDWKIRPQI